MVSAIHWHESAMDLYVFPFPIPPSHLPFHPSLWVFPVHQPWALVSCIQPGLVICLPQLSYLFICWWASRLLSFPGYYKQCCDEHWGARVSFRSGFLGVYAQKWDCWSNDVLSRGRNMLYSRLRNDGMFPFWAWLGSCRSEHEDRVRWALASDGDHSRHDRGWKENPRRLGSRVIHLRSWAERLKQGGDHGMKTGESSWSHWTVVRVQGRVAGVPPPSSCLRHWQRGPPGPSQPLHFQKERRLSPSWAQLLGPHENTEIWEWETFALKTEKPHPSPALLHPSPTGAPVCLIKQPLRGSEKWDLLLRGVLSRSVIFHLLQSRTLLAFFFKFIFYFFIFIFLNVFIFLISWRLITLQYYSGFCHTLTWIRHGYTCIPHPDPPSHLPLHPIPLGLPSAPGLGTCLMHPTREQHQVSK